MGADATRILVVGDKNLSSWSLRPWLAMKMAWVEFEERLIRLDRPETKAEIAKYSPAGLVPCLVDGELTVWDSLAIIEYAAELAPGLWPADPRKRAVARAVSAEMHSGFATLRDEWPMNFTARTPATARSPALERDIDRIDAIWRSCRERHGDGGPFLFGPFCAADAMFAPVASRFVTYRGKTGEAALDAYVAALMALEPLREWGEDAAVEAAEAAQA